MVKSRGGVLFGWFNLRAAAAGRMRRLEKKDYGDSLMGKKGNRKQNKITKSQHHHQQHPSIHRSSDPSSFDGQLVK